MASTTLRLEDAISWAAVAMERTWATVSSTASRISARAWLVQHFGGDSQAAEDVEHPEDG
jgi:hypothetical protein